MKFKLKSAHYFPGDLYLVGEKEADDKATIVGDDTRYPIVRFSEAKPGDMTPTIEMEPLDEEAEEALAEEMTRMAESHASMSPVEQLTLTLDAAKLTDSYDKNYVAGFNVKRGK